LALCATPAKADSVFLRNGTRLAGEVDTARSEVTVKTEDGVLTLPAWRVARVEWADALAVPSPQLAGRPAPAASSKVRAPRGPSEPAVAQPSGPPRVKNVLATRMSVDFDGVSLHDALEYVREVTGVNMALSSDVRADAEPIHLHLEQVRLETILELILEPRGFSYTVRPGQVLYVRAGAAGNLVPRVYEVTDLLVSTEDRGLGQQGAGRGGGAAAGRGSAAGLSPQFAGTSRNARAGLSPQFAGTSRNARTVSGGRNGQYGGNGSSITSRAENLVFIIKGTCGRGTWMDPTSSGVIDVAGTAGGRGQQSVGGFGY